MSERDDTIETFAAYGMTPERIQRLLADLRARLGSEFFYVFHAASGAGSGGNDTPRRPRTLMAFASPDAALVFAQRNGLISQQTPARLRVMRLPRLLLAMALGPNVQAILFIPDGHDAPAGQTPDGELVERSALRG